MAKSSRPRRACSRAERKPDSSSAPIGSSSAPAADSFAGCGCARSKRERRRRWRAEVMGMSGACASAAVFTPLPKMSSAEQVGDRLQHLIQNVAQRARGSAVEQVRHCAQQIAEEVAGTALGADVEHDFAQIDLQTEQIQ